MIRVSTNKKYERFQTSGFADQVEGLNVESRLSKSFLSHGLHDGCEYPMAEPPAVVLNEACTGCEPMRDTESALEPCSWSNQSVLAALTGMTGDEAPAELKTRRNHFNYFTKAGD